jgi:hypothetical protein
MVGFDWWVFLILISLWLFFLVDGKRNLPKCEANMENQSIKLLMLPEIYRTRDNKFSCKMY